MIDNIHSRKFEADIDDVGEALETLGGPHDRWWKTTAVADMRLDHGLDVGSSGGHGPVRYQVISHETRRSVVFQFAPKIGLDGTHSFRITGGSGRVEIVHELRARPYGFMRIAWPTMVRPMHDAAIEDVFDNVQAQFTGVATRAQRTPRWVRLAGRLARFTDRLSVPRAH